MTGYISARRTAEVRTITNADAADRRTTARDRAPAVDALGTSLNESPRSRALTQLRTALDGGPRVQALQGLGRALNRTREPEEAEPEQSQSEAIAQFAAMPHEAGTPDDAPPAQKKSNATGLPDRLKTGVENLSGLAMDDVRVHYNSSKPAAVQAHAYAQGTDIHLGPGQEKHLPHEAWHVVQQKQGRVKPTLQMKGIAINDDAGLEREADAMGAKAPQMRGIEHIMTGPIVDATTLEPGQREPTGASGVPGAALGAPQAKGRFNFLSAVAEPWGAGSVQAASYGSTVQRFLTDKDGVVWMGGDPATFFGENEARIRQALMAYGFRDIPPNLGAIMRTLMQKNVVEYTIEDLAQKVSESSAPSAVWGRYETSKNEAYAVDPGDRRVLYAKLAAPEPRPNGLYGRSEVLVHGNHAVRWSPNVRFSSKTEVANITKLASGEKPNMEEANKLVKTIEDSVGDRFDTKKGSPTRAVVGPNDCRAWAAQLRYLIVLELKEEELAKGNESSPFDLANNPHAPDLKPGDQVTHTLTGPGVSVECGYHSATVVASDGSSSVTLEGDASKDLTVPDFHIREGVTGFVDANDTTPLGEKKGFDKKGTVHDVRKSKSSAVKELETVESILKQYDGKDPDILLMSVLKFKVLMRK